MFNSIFHILTRNRGPHVVLCNDNPLLANVGVFVCVRVFISVNFFKETHLFDINNSNRREIAALPLVLIDTLQSIFLSQHSSSLNMRLCQHKWEGSCFLGEIHCCTGNCAFWVCQRDNGHLFVIIIGRQRKCDRLQLSMITFIITIRRSSANTIAAYHRRWHQNQRNSCYLDYQAKASCLRWCCAKGCIMRERYAWKTCEKVSAYSLLYEKEMVFCVHNTSPNLLRIRLEYNWLSEFFSFYPYCLATKSSSA